MCNKISLHTNIPQEFGLKAVIYYIIEYRNQIIFSKKSILEEAKFMLKNNKFIFLEEMFNQTKCTAMGTKLALPYANLFV